MELTSSPTFAQLFRRYRISHFSTLSELADALADEGLIIDISILSRWQTGDRVPKSRQNILGLLKIFTKTKVLNDMDSANKMLELCGLNFLTGAEIMELFPKVNGIDSVKYEIVRINEAIFLFKHYYDFFSEIKDKKFQQDFVKDEIDQLFNLTNLCLNLNLYKESTFLWSQIADFLWNSGRWLELETLSKKVLNLAELFGDKKLQAKIMTRYLARIAYWHGSEEEAKKMLLKSLQMSGESESNLVVETYLRLGLSAQSDNSELALKYYWRALKLQNQLPDKLFLSKIYNYIGHLMGRQGKFVAAKKYFEKVIALNGNKDDVARAFQHLAAVNREQNNHSISLSLLRRSLQIRTKQDSLSGYAFGKIGLAIETGDESHRREAENIFSSLGMFSSSKQIISHYEIYR